MANGLMVIGGSGNPALTLEICKELNIEPGAIKLKQFADGEMYPQLVDNVRGFDVFVVQPTCKPVNDNLMELMLIIDALRRASAKRITAVIPYFGYARQDRKDKPRVPISAKVVSSMLEMAKVKRILALDLHSAPIGGFFDIPVDHLYALPVMLDYIRSLNLPNLTIVSPDAGGVTRARLTAEKLGVPMAIIDKRRVDTNVAEIMNVIGDVAGRDCLMVDDMIDTGGTLVKGAAALIAKGASSVRACATHGVFSPKNGMSAYARIEASPIIEVIVTNSIPQVQPNSITGMTIINNGLDPATVTADKTTKIRTLSVAPLLAAGIRSIHEQTSVSKLFV